MCEMVDRKYNIEKEFNRLNSFLCYTMKVYFQYHLVSYMSINIITIIQKVSKQYFILSFVFFKKKISFVSNFYDFKGIQLNLTFFFHYLQVSFIFLSKFASLFLFLDHLVTFLYYLLRIPSNFLQNYLFFTNYTLLSIPLKIRSLLCLVPIQFLSLLRIYGDFIPLCQNFCFCYTWHQLTLALISNQYLYYTTSDDFSQVFFFHQLHASLIFFQILCS